MAKYLLIDDEKTPGVVAGLIMPGDLLSDQTDWEALHAKRLTWQRNITWAKSGEEAITAVKKGGWDTILLDHDLGGEISGSDISSYLKNNPAKLAKEVYLISFNSWGRKKMFNDLKKFYGFQDNHFVIIHLFGKVEE